MRIAITGGIGSGKSVVLNMLKTKGYKVISADEVNNTLIHNKAYIDKISHEFPSVVVDNAIDKKALSSIVFANKEKLDILNSIAHPAIRKLTLDMSKVEGIAFVEVPLLFECGFEVDYDKVILVTADKDIRIKRVINRDNRSIEEIESIIDNQVKSYDNKKIDFIINNNGDLETLEKQVDEIIKSL